MYIYVLYIAIYVCVPYTAKYVAMCTIYSYTCTIYSYTCTQIWYADDACACGSITRLHHCWGCLCRIGPDFGYNVNTWLVIKYSFQSVATAQFLGTGMKITCDGQPYLGTAIGT